MWDQILSSVLGQAAQSMNLNSPDTERYFRWVTGLVQNALVKWRVLGQSGLKCKIQMQSQSGRVVGCEAPAVLVCQVCNEPTCLSHAFVTSDGTGVCAGCVTTWKQVKANGPQAQENPAELRKKYLSILGLSEGSSKEEIQAAYKELVKKHHPDKQRTSSAKKKAHDKMVELNRAYDWLVRNSS